MALIYLSLYNLGSTAYCKVLHDKPIQSLGKRGETFKFDLNQPAQEEEEGGWVQDHTSLPPPPPQEVEVIDLKNKQKQPRKRKKYIMVSYTQG